MRKLFLSWQNYSTCEDCAHHLKRDVFYTIIFSMLGYFIHPYLDTFPVVWWMWNIGYIGFMTDHFFMLCQSPKSPPFTLSMFIALRIGAKEFYEKTKNAVENNNRLYHFHREGLADEKRANEEEEKQALKTQDVEPVQKKLTKKEELENSLLEFTEKLKKWEQMFDDWSSAKAKEMAHLVAEETNAEKQKSAFCRQMERIKEEIAALELESKVLAKKIIESESNRNKLTKKRLKLEARTDERLQEHEIEKAKLLDAIEKIKSKLEVQD